METSLSVGPGLNMVTMTDSYKLTHYKMYPPGVEYVGSYFENRAGGEFSDTVFFGLQYLMRRYLEGSVVNLDDIIKGKEFCKKHFGQDLFNEKGWMHILEKFDGVLPISIRAVPEGTVVNESNVLFTIENTDPMCPWLTNHLETLLVQLWYPCTVATVSREQKKYLKEILEVTGSLDKLPFMLHDFGYRGSSSLESAALGDAAHLVNFMGTDTIAGIELLQSYYGADMPAFSVPAAEHSTITSWGEDREMDAYRHILEQYPTGIVSVVSDSYDIFRACKYYWGSALKAEVLGDGKRTLVIRPDSGNPTQTVVKCLDILGKEFGYTVNDKGYKVLPDQVRMIYGDGISRNSLPVMLISLKVAGWSLDNLVFGSGGGLLQDCNRDTQRMAMKCSWVQFDDGKVQDVFKSPIDDITKISKKGKIKLVLKGDGQFETVRMDDPRDDQLVEVFRNGEVLVDYNFDSIRERAVL